MVAEVLMLLTLGLAPVDEHQHHSNKPGAGRDVLMIQPYVSIVEEKAGELKKIGELLGFNVELFAGTRGRTPLKPLVDGQFGCGGLHTFDAQHASSATPHHALVIPHSWQTVSFNPAHPHPYLHPHDVPGRRTVYIATIEKSLGIVDHLHASNTLDRLGLVIVDELHMIVRFVRVS